MYGGNGNLPHIFNIFSHLKFLSHENKILLFFFLALITIFSIFFLRISFSSHFFAFPTIASTSTFFLFSKELFISSFNISISIFAFLLVLKINLALITLELLKKIEVSFGRKSKIFEKIELFILK